MSYNQQSLPKNGKIVVITGVTRGLGRAMAEEFIRLGHSVIGCGRSTAEISGLSSRFGNPQSFQALDITDDDRVQEWAQRVLGQYPAPDYLLNNAALINRNASLWEVSAKEFSEVIDVNLKGMVNVIRHFVPAMIEARKGVIVNFSSGWGRSTSPEVAPYCATKWAVEGLTQALAQELPPGLAAIPLNPGIINTEMLRSCFGTSAASYPEPTQWARLAVPFILKLGPSQNGQALTVAGV